jgi:hypothetical protein
MDSKRDQSDDFPFRPDEPIYESRVLSADPDHRCSTDPVAKNVGDHKEFQPKQETSSRREASPGAMGLKVF